MQKILLIALISLYLNANAQQQFCKSAGNPFELSANQMTATFYGGGSFFDFDQPFGLKTPNSNYKKLITICQGALWMSGKTPNNRLKLAANTFLHNLYNDYQMGVIPDTFFDCRIWESYWTISAQEIERHVKQLNEGGIIRDSVAAIFAWPGRNNPYFSHFTDFKLPKNQDFAPFFDKNGDGNYTPQYGDYPLPEGVNPKAVPDEFAWGVYNDAREHTSSSRSEPIGAEIHESIWAYAKTGDLIDKCVFMSQKIINKGQENLDSFRIGYWFMPNDCVNNKSLVGSYPSQNALYFYNDSVKTNDLCLVGQEFLNNYPTQAISFLNRPMTNSIFFFNSGVVSYPVAQNNPSSSISFHNYLNGKWADGTALTRGNWGLNPNSTNYTAHIFPDFPKDTSGWSHYQVVKSQTLWSRIYPIMSSYVGRFNVNDTVRLDAVLSLHSEPNSNSISNPYLLIGELPKLKRLYQNKFADLNRLPDIDIPKYNDLLIFPNPNDGRFTISVQKNIVKSVEIYNILGHQVGLFQYNEQPYFDINASYLPKGHYILKINTDKEIFTRKIVIH